MKYKNMVRRLVSLAVAFFVLVFMIPSVAYPGLAAAKRTTATSNSFSEIAPWVISCAYILGVTCGLLSVIDMYNLLKQRSRAENAGAHCPNENAALPRRFSWVLFVLYIGWIGLMSIGGAMYVVFIWDIRL